MDDWEKSELDKWIELADLIEKAGITAANRFAKVKVRLFQRTRDPSHLKDLFRKFPGMGNKAKLILAESPFAPYPIRDELQRILGQFNIGIVNKNGDMAGLNPLDFTRGVTGFGETGSGKSFWLLWIIEQILSIPVSDRDFNVIIVQALKKDADFFIKRFPNLRLIEWENLRRAPFQTEKWDKKKRKTSSISAVYSYSKWLIMHSRILFEKALELASAKKEIMTFTDIKYEVDNAASQLGLKGHEHRNVLDHVRMSLDSFIKRGKIVNCQKGYPIDDFFTKEDIILNVCDEDDDRIVGTIVTDILIDIQRYHEAHPIYPPKLRTLVVIDEGRRIFPNTDTMGNLGHDPQTAMQRFATTRRSSGVGLITITQEPKSLPTWLIDNSAFVFSFPIGGTVRA